MQHVQLLQAWQYKELVMCWWEVAYTEGCHSLTVLSLEPEAMVPFTPSNATDVTAAYIQQIASELDKAE